MNKLKALRLQKGLTQEQFAQLVGTTQEHISKIERGIHKIAYDKYEQWINILINHKNK